MRGSSVSLAADEIRPLGRRLPHHLPDDEPEGVAPGRRHRAREARADGILEDRRERVPEAGIMAAVDALEAMAGGDGLDVARLAPFGEGPGLLEKHVDESRGDGRGPDEGRALAFGE